MIHTHTLTDLVAYTHTRTHTHITHRLTDLVADTHCGHTHITHTLTDLVAGAFCVAFGALQGVGCAPWRPLVSAALPVAFAWQVRHLVLREGSDVRPGVPWSPPLCRWLLRGRCGAWCFASGRVDALASLRLRRSAGGFSVAGAALRSDVRPGVPWSPPLCRWLCVAGAALGALQGVGCMPWRPLVSAALPVAFAWQVRHLVLCRGRMYALASLGLRRSAGGFCVAGAALGALQGVGCTPWRPLVSAGLPVAFAWQVRHLVLCKRFDVHPGVPWSPPVCRWLLRGRCGTWCSASGRMYALASLSLRRSAGGFCVAGAALGALQAAALPVAFAWQVRHLEVGCTPLLVSFSLPVAFAWQVRRWVLRDEAE